jgi:L,D-transpeptidase catalytic domain
MIRMLLSPRSALAAGVVLLALTCNASSALAETSTAPAATAPTSPPTPAPATTTGTPEQPGGSPTPAPAETQLSNELTLTAWAHPEATGWIYVHPTGKSTRIAKVHLYTAEGFPEVYLLLSSRVDAAGREWDKVRVPGRPNGRTGWLLGELLGTVQHTHWRIVVNRRQRRMRVYLAGHLLRLFPVGVGKPSTPTPAGHFWIDERFKLSNPSNPYWPYALGTSDYSTLPNWPAEGVIGIHGPFGEPQKIPGDPSHGCIRMRSADIAWLGPRVTLGTPVEVI